METTAPRQYQSPPAVARRLGVTPEKIIGWIRAGELPAVDVSTRRGGRPRYKIAPADLDAFLLRRSVAPPTRTARRPRRTDPNITEFF